MIQTTNFPLSTYSLKPYGSWAALEKKVRALGLDGLEVIADPDNLADDIPRSLAAGYHMQFYPDWLDFFREDKAALIRKFGSLSFAENFYRCKTPDDMVGIFRSDLSLGIRLGAPYMVFHVSDVSLEEGYNYQWEHTNREVLDASLAVINEILRGVEPTFDFLVENQWWPGFTFTDPEETEYLLSGIRYPRVGIMLDTGHLMNTCWSIRNQRQGVRYILEMIEKHGRLSESVLGLHFHQSVSGAYCKKTVGTLPEDFPLDYYEEFSRNYAHILQIDRHRPWTEASCVQILERTQPKYLTHELAGSPHRERSSIIRRQMRTIERGYALGLDRPTEEASAAGRDENTR